ncbi:MAG: hypothetical protein KDC44_22695, partial [Phaeodactylibacter sp.]|nr:hypothetical protein [Phaeodactylibacter sp.]
MDQRNYAQLQAFGFSGYSNFFAKQEILMTSAAPRGVFRDADGAAPPPPPPAPTAEAPQEYSAELAEDDAAPKSGASTPEPQNAPEAQAGGAEKLDDVPVRTNLNETVFFYPHLATDEEGNILIKFKMNEALTRWKFLSFAHTKELASVLSTKEIVTQKDLMVVPNPPR